MSSTPHSTSSTLYERYTRPPTANPNNLNRQLDYISVGVVCGLIVVFFVVCFIVGCRRTKRRQPRCQDFSTPSVEQSRSGMYGWGTWAMSRNTAPRTPRAPLCEYACTAGNWTFHPFVSSSPSLIRRFLLTFLLIQLKPKHHRLHVLTIFQRGARGAVFRDIRDLRIKINIAVRLLWHFKRFGWSHHWL